MTFSVQGTAPPVQVGEIMVNTVEPYFLKKVTQVISQNANELVVETEDAALTDVIEDATIRRTFRVPATKLALTSPTAAGPITLHADAAAKLSLTNCDISFSREYRFEADIESFNLKSFEVGVTGDLVATLEMGLEAYRAFSLNADQTVGQWPPYSFKIPVGWLHVPIKVQGEFGVGADFSAAATGRITSGIIMTKPVAIGVEYKNGSLQELTGGSQATYEVHEPTLDLQGSVSVRGYMRGQLDIEILGVGGPYFGVSPYLSFDAVTNQEQKQIDWRLHTGVDGYAGVKATIFDKIGIRGIVADKSWDFKLYMALLKEGVIPLDEIAMVWIEPGTFQMGSPPSEPDHLPSEGPVHEVTISRGFYLGKYEITQAQWERVMGTRPWQDQHYVRSGPNYPAVYISWEDAQEFIRRLNKSLGLGCVSFANRGRMGICVPGWDDDALVFW